MISDLYVYHLNMCKRVMIFLEGQDSVTELVVKLNPV